MSEGLAGATGLPAGAALAEDEVYVFPPSYAQERLWFLDQLHPGRVAYTIAGAFRLEGSLDAAALRRSVQEIVRRHESLRTTFRVIDGQLRQVVHARSAVVLAEVDLGRGPLLRPTVFRLSPREHVLVFAVHHIVADGWSLGILTRELAALYEAFVRGRPSPLPELPIQYADYAHWQREWLQGGTREELLRYWREQLGGAPARLELPFDGPRPAVPTFRAGHCAFSVPRSLTESLLRLGQGQDATLFMVLLAACTVWLWRYTGQSDVVVGSPIAGRTHSETEGLIGLFLNTLALRTPLSGALSFREVLARTRETALGAYAHQDVPFEQLVEDLHPQRDSGRHPLFQFLFVLQNASRDVLELPGLVLRPVELPPGEAKLDLGLSMTEGASGLGAVVEYARDLFEPETIGRMAAGLKTLLEAVVVSPDRPIRALPAGDEATRHEVLSAWSGALVAEPPAALVHERIQGQARRRPDAAAVRCGDDALTYAELLTRSRRLAGALQARGVSPEVRVGLFVERSLDMIVGLLAVLQAGGVYVPLEPGEPEDRIALIARDAGLSLVLTQDALAPRLVGIGLPTLSIGEAAAASSPPPRESGVTPENLAYLIYTSGSTGRPKGVMVEHRALAQRVASMTEAYGISERDRILQFISLSFDAAAEEVFPALASGATLVVLPRPSSCSADDLQRECTREAISVLHLPVAYWHHLVDGLATSGQRMPSCLRALIVGGERPSAERLRRWSSCVESPCRVFNAYGPTETTITATVHEVGAADAGAPPPIGRPLAGTRTYVLDGWGSPVPPGGPGELSIGGAGLARGYAGRPDLTAERFVPDPFAATPGARLYRTGDVVRHRREGALMFLGRLDDQLKIRGHRVEPGEITSVLSEHPGVGEAVVTLRGEGPDAVLVAHVAARAGGRLDAADVRAFLGARLPAHMVPSSIVVLPALPRTPGGKVDRAALPEAPVHKAPLEEARPRPQGELESAIASVWTEVLGLEPGATDNFFDVGGNSLRLLDVHRRLTRRLGRDLPTIELFRHPTVRALAAFLGGAMAVDAARRAEASGQRQRAALGRQQPRATARPSGPGGRP
jgi:amino acid adenylation domain-containing protein